MLAWQWHSATWFISKLLTAAGNNSPNQYDTMQKFEIYLPCHPHCPVAVPAEVILMCHTLSVAGPLGGANSGIIRRNPAHGMGACFFTFLLSLSVIPHF